jgi:hypothetical protein
MGQGRSQCFSVMVTTTVRPIRRYSPLTISCEKRPEPSSPTRFASFSLAAFLALFSSEEASTVVAMLKVLATMYFLPCSRMAPRSGSAGLRRQPDKACHPLPSCPGSCWSCWARTTPTRDGGPGRRSTATPLKTTRQRTSEFLVAHPDGLSLKSLHQPQLPFGKVVPVAGERAREVLPRPSEKVGIRCGPACQKTQYGFAQSSPRIRPSRRR